LGGLRGRAYLSVGRSYSGGEADTDAEAAGCYEFASRKLGGFHRALPVQVVILSISPRSLWQANINPTVCPELDRKSIFAFVVLWREFRMSRLPTPPHNDQF
jgi:hypothetical protein